MRDDDEDEEEDLDALREKYKKLLGGSKNSAFEDKVEENEDEDEGKRRKSQKGANI